MSTSMARNDDTFNVSTELSALKHEMKNQKMTSLPANMTVQRRPLYHPPVASLFAGENVQKVVYVSSHTPLMSAVKRVKKLLSEIEKRAIQSANVKEKRHSRSIAGVAEASAHLAESNEGVSVKASGRAMQQALKVGEWFRSKEREVTCNVEVRTSSVQAIDDIVEAEGEQIDSTVEQVHDKEGFDSVEASTGLEGGETTMELLGDTSVSAREIGSNKVPESKQSQEDSMHLGQDSRQKRKRVKRKRSTYETNEVPEARIRWVKTVEVIISFKA